MRFGDLQRIDSVSGHEDGLRTISPLPTAFGLRDMAVPASCHYAASWSRQSYSSSYASWERLLIGSSVSIHRTGPMIRGAATRAATVPCGLALRAAPTTCVDADEAELLAARGHHLTEGAQAPPKRTPVVALTSIS